MSIMHEPAQAEENIWHFKRFLNLLIKGDERYRDLVVPIIKEAQDFINSKETVYSITRNNYDIILFIAEQAKEVVLLFDIDKLSKDDLTNLAIALSVKPNLPPMNNLHKEAEQAADRQFPVNDALLPKDVQKINPYRRAGAIWGYLSHASKHSEEVERLKDLNISDDGLDKIHRLYEAIGRLVFDDVHEDVVGYLQQPFVSILKQRGFNLSETDL